MWVQVIVDFLDALKFILEKLGLYKAPVTTTQEK